MRKTTVAILMLTFAISVTGCKVKHAEEVTEPGETIEQTDELISVKVRYSNKNYEKYLQYCEEEYEKDNRNTDIILEYAETQDYVQNINNDSINRGNVPDVYITDNSNLGTLYLAGLASKNKSELYTADNYCDTALRACSYEGNLIAYPLAYETCCMVYNSDYLKAENVSTFESLEDYSDNADFTSEESAMVETIFRTEINDMFINYGFMGSGIDIGGKYGEDSSIISINNEDVNTSADEYVGLIDYFSLNKDYSYESIITKFKKGSILSAIISTDTLKELEDCDINYDITGFPDYSEKLKTSPLSLTWAMVVNPYTGNMDEAEKFAIFASYESAAKVYEYTSYPSALSDVEYDNERISKVYESYEKSSPKNKIMYGEQVYPLLEIAFHNIAAGEDAEKELAGVEDYMKKQF